ncbi:DEAD/DEAH box helicase [Staphylococcus cornubiensis]|uniref:DEAD/DEAH box helicase n=1 Tax=Staphylococcus cornubiensis TaxID=1986155 RepID=UPI000A38FD9D|nr:AAA domain-containing protein [Staphylococcus cornubiensis]
MGGLVRNTLSAWALLETLQPGTIEDIKSYLNKNIFAQNEQQKKVHDYTSFYTIWEDDRFQLREDLKEKSKIQFQMYRFNFKFGEVEKLLRSMFDDEEVYNVDQTDCYGYTFMVDEEGYVLIETLHVPMLMSALAQIEKNKSADIEAIYYDHFEKFKHKCEEVMGNNLLDKGKLSQLDELYRHYFKVLISEHSGYFKHTVAIHHIENDKQNNDLNSFFITDLEMAKNNPNETLKQYINGLNDDDRNVIDENREVIEHYLEPQNYPDGRWPSLVEHRLSLMQQVAVNQITSDADQVSSVNGPPGTGKTTLLKDIFAHHIVERAKTFAELSRPTDAFTYKKIHETDQYATAFLNQKHAQFKMVVASSNNGAVENISKDLPKLSEIIRNDQSTQFPHYEEGYQEVAQQLGLFKNIAEKLIGEPAWGLFSGVFGKKANIDQVMAKMISDSESQPMNKLLIETLNTTDINREWKEAKKSFEKTLEQVKVIKEEISEGVTLYQKMQQQAKQSQQDIVLLDEYQTKINYFEGIEELKNQRNDILRQIEKIESDRTDIEHLIEVAKAKMSLIEKVKDKFTGNEKVEAYRTEIEALLTKKIELNKQKSIVDTRIDESEQLLEALKAEKNKVETRLSDYQIARHAYSEFVKAHPDIHTPNDNFWEDTSEAYQARQEKVLWTSDALQFHRGLLFLKAMVLHKLILVGNAKQIQSGLYDFQRRFEYMLSSPTKVENAWNVIHLIFPVISTTFASFRMMYQTMPKDFIDYLFIDEAGQAVPQAAVGAIQRSRHVVAVGDPIQIEPVVTLDKNLVDLVRKAYGVPERLVSVEASVQTLADHANRYGYWKEAQGNKQWIGIPLWVHRRCLNPMFAICNKIAYEEKMVLPQYIKNSEHKGIIGRVSWLDVKGKANPKQYVKEQGEAVVAALYRDWEEAKNMNQYPPNVFVISPFTQVKNEIIKLARIKLDKMMPEGVNLMDWLLASIGTVHTFQGKEAAKVYFVTGTDETQNGAIKWSCQKPNLINVAVTRAKKEFVIVGDKARIREFDYYKTIDEEKNA